MDTKEKRPEKTRTADNAQRRKRPEAREAERRRPAETAPERKKQAPKADARKKADERRTERREENTARRRPAGQTQQRPIRRNAIRTDGRGRPLTAEDGIQYSAPQGTGPRKSAPKMTRQEAEALRYRQQAQPEVRQAEKKNALKDLLSGIRGEKTEGGNAEQAAQRRAERAAKEEKKRQAAQRHDTPAIIYTQPQVFNRDRLLVQILSVIAVVAAMVIGMSLFFKVKTITVAGAETYNKDAIVDASGIKEGDGLLTFSKARASAKIRAKLHYVDNIRIGIKLPDTVTIYIEELDVTYAIESIQGDMWLINSDGKVVDQITSSEGNNYTRIHGIQLLDPAVGAQAMAADEIPEETLESGEPVPLTVTGAQRLASLLQILKALEANDIVGEAASVDISDLEDIRLMYGTQYEVLLGDTTRMEYKIACMNDAILELSEFQAGILDISFVHWQDKVGYTPFG